MTCKHKFQFSGKYVSKEEIKNANKPFRWTIPDIAQFICSECGLTKYIKIKESKDIK